MKLNLKLTWIRFHYSNTVNLFKKQNNFNNFGGNRFHIQIDMNHFPREDMQPIQT